MRTLKGIVFTALAGSLLFTVAGGAESASDNFDTSRVITVRGTIDGLVNAGPTSPHFYLKLNAKSSRGGPEAWLIEGKSRSALLQDGWTFGEGKMLARGKEISISAYGLKPAVDMKQILAVFPPHLQENLKIDHVAHGLEITLSNGQKKAFGDK